MKLLKILCWLGFHKWVGCSGLTKICFRCMTMEVVNQFKNIEIVSETRILGNVDCCGNRNIYGVPHYHNGSEDHETIITTVVNGDRILSTRKKSEALSQPKEELGDN